MNITTANKKMEQKSGGRILRALPYDLRERLARYEVMLPSGKKAVMGSVEIKSLIRG